jgi:pilus assembly protein Flp/PilA
MVDLIDRQWNQVRDLAARLFNREEGQDMIEYALLAALISIAAIAVIILVGPELKNLFQDVVNALQKTS